MSTLIVREYYKTLAAARCAVILYHFMGRAASWTTAKDGGFEVCSWYL